MEPAYFVVQFRALCFVSNNVLVSGASSHALPRHSPHGRGCIVGRVGGEQHSKSVPELPRGSCGRSCARSKPSDPTAYYVRGSDPLLFARICRRSKAMSRDCQKISIVCPAY